MKTLNPTPTSRRRRRAAISVEYILILGLVVLPIGLMLPFFIDMLRQYSERFSFIMRTPFP